MGKEVETVSGRFQHTHACGYQKQTSVIVGGEDEFTSAVSLHPTDTKKSADTLSGAR